MNLPSLDDLEFLTVSEVAEYLRLANMTVYRLIERGDLKGTVRIGRSFRIPSQSVRDYLARQAR